MRRIAVTNQKGGSGKTTTATALAVGLAMRGRRTLLVDLDGQANATWTLMGGQGAGGPTLADVLLRDATADEAIRPTATARLDILPADGSLNGVNVALVQELGRDTRLRSALAPLDDRWDVAIFDTGPSLNTVMANALVAAGEVVVPVDPGVYAMLGLVALQETIAEVRDAYGTDLRLRGLLLTRVQRNNVHRDVESELRSRFGELVFKTTIPMSAMVEAAATRGTTVLAHAPKSPAALAYDKLIEEIANERRAKDRGGVETVGRPGTSAA